METQSKPRVTQVFEKLSPELQEQVKLTYPYGFRKHLISFVNKEGKTVKGLRFETDEKIYLIRMTIAEARDIIEQDDDYGDDGSLKTSVRVEYEDKYSDLDYIPDYDSEDDDED